MSLFKSKVFWLCAVVCIGIAGFLGINAYKSQSSKEAVIIYKTTQPPPLVKPLETTPENQGVVEQAAPSVETGDSLETEFSSVETFEADPLMFTPDDSNEELSVEGPQFTNQNDDIINEEIDLEIDLEFEASDFSAELQKRFMSVMSRYPLLSMSESEIFKLMQTREGRLEVLRQAEEIQVEMRRMGHEYIPRLSDEQKQQAKQETRRMLSEHLTPAEIESYISQFPW